MLPVLAHFARQEVERAGRERHGASFEVLSTNALDDHFDASPALVGSEMYLRGMKYLYSRGN